MKMICPYCGITFSLDGVSADYSFPKFEKFRPCGRSSPRDDAEKQYSIISHRCPECRKQIMWLKEIGSMDEVTNGEPQIVRFTLLFPKWPATIISSQIPEPFASGFHEAHNTLAVSPKASAALSRRCLQNLIRGQEQIVEKTLQAEIEKLFKLNKLPKYLADDLDSIRAVGNFAAHAIKNTNTGEIVDVEPGEAEWTLEVLKELLNFYFVDSRKSQARRDALNKKLKDAGKGPLLKS